MDVVTRLVYQALEHVDKETMSGTLGSKFLELVEREKQRKSGQKLETPEDIDEEFIRQVQYLHTCEQANDLAWMDYSSWGNTSFDFRNKFTAVVSPLEIGSGIYFSYTKFLDNARALMARNDYDSIVFVLRDGPNFRIACVSSRSKQYNWMKQSKLEAIKRTFRTNTIISMVNSSTGVTVKAIEITKEG